jgi:thiamine kinase-like enzyme
MEDFDKIKSNITNYVIKKYNIQLPEKYIGVHLESVGGLSNTNYVATITNKTTNERIGQILYRKYGEISDVVDRDLETMIINDLAQKGVGPKIYQKDPNGKYRIDEYIANTSPIDKKDEFDPLVIKQVIQIVNNYNLIMNVYKYNINNDKINVSIVKDGSSQAKVRINNNMYDKCMIEMYNKAIKSFNIFSEEFKSNINRENNKVLYEQFESLENYMVNYKKLFTNIFPKSGFMILCHNDIHRLNLIVRKSDNKLFVLDHEYACLNLVGNDFANYMNESCFIYEPEYIFTKDLINFDKYYGYYKNYLKVFCENHKFLNGTDDGKKFLKEIQTKKYYLKLHVVINLFWFLYCVIYLNFSEFNKDQKNFFYFQHGIHRIYYIEAAMKAIEELP